MPVLGPSLVAHSPGLQHAHHELGIGEVEQPVVATLEYAKQGKPRPGRPGLGFMLGFRIGLCSELEAGLDV